MKSKSFYLVVLAILVWGCPVEKDPAPIQSCQLTSNQFSGNSFPYFFKYTYNHQQQLVQISSADTSNTSIYLTYDAQGRLIREKEDKTAWTSEYNVKNQLIKQTRTFTIAPGRDEVNYYLHDYDQPGQLTESRFYNAAEPNYVQYRYRYSYTDGVITKVETKDYAINGPEEDITYTYDGKKQAYPLLPLIQFYKHFGDDHPVIGLIGGNVTSCTIVDKITGAKSPWSYTVAYTYNQENYPTEAIITSGNGTKKIRFNYNCR